MNLQYVESKLPTPQPEVSSQPSPASASPSSQPAGLGGLQSLHCAPTKATLSTRDGPTCKPVAPNNSTLWSPSSVFLFIPSVHSCKASAGINTCVEMLASEVPLRNCLIFLPCESQEYSGAQLEQSFPTPVLHIHPYGCCFEHVLLHT